MIKNFMSTSPSVISTSKMETMGGVDIVIQPAPELNSLILWWNKWGAVFCDDNPTVKEALIQARVLHELAKVQS